MFSYRSARPWLVRLGLLGQLMLMTSLGTAPAQASPAGHAAAPAGVAMSGRIGASATAVDTGSAPGNRAQAGDTPVALINDTAAYGLTGADPDGSSPRMNGALLGGLLGALGGLLIGITVKLVRRVNERGRQKASVPPPRQEPAPTPHPPTPAASRLPAPPPSPVAPASTVGLPGSAPQPAAPPVSASGGFGPPVALAAAPRRTRRFWRNAMITAIVGVVLLCLVCAVAVRLVQRSFGPEAAVRAYFDALADRDANKARELLADGSVIGQSGPIAGVNERADLSLLTNDILRSRGYTPPSNLRIVHTNWTGASATVQAWYSAGGPTINITLPLIDERGTRGLPAWRITDGLLELWLHPAVTGREVVVADTSLRVASARGSLVAFPGGYRVTLPEHPLYQAPSVIAFAGDGSPSPSVEVRESVRQDIEQQVRAHVDGCARHNELAPPGCPFYASNNSMAPATAVDWTISQYPKLTFAVVEGGTVSVTSAADGIATATATFAPASGGGTWQQHFPFDIRGTVQVVDGKAVLSIAPWRMR